jgi:hypothetical protein
LKECYIWKIPLKDERLLLRKIPLKGWTVTRKYHSVTFVVHAINHIPFSLLRWQAHANSSPSPCSGNRHTWTGVVQEKLAAPDHWRRCGHSSYRRCSRRGRRAGGRGRRWAVEVVTPDAGWITSPRSSDDVCMMRGPPASTLRRLAQASGHTSVPMVGPQFNEAASGPCYTRCCYLIYRGWSLAGAALRRRRRRTTHHGQVDELQLHSSGLRRQACAAASLCPSAGLLLLCWPCAEGGAGGDLGLKGAGPRAELRKEKRWGFQLGKGTRARRCTRRTSLTAFAHGCNRMLFSGDGLTSMVFYGVVMFWWYFPDMMIFQCYETNFPMFKTH